MDFTRLSTFQTCPEKYRLKYVEGLKKVSEDKWQLPRLFGSAIHAGLQAHYLGQSQEAIGKAFLGVLPAEIDLSDVARTPVHGLKLLEAYTKYWAAQDREMKVLSVEVHDKVDIGAAEPWEVKIDLVIETPNGIMGMDHKTTAKPFGEDYWRQFEPNSQVSGYIYYLQKKYGQCSGLLINGIRYGYRQRVYKGEPAGFWWEFQRQMFNRTSSQLEDWRRRTVVGMKRLSANVVMNPALMWEKHEQQCGYCEFRELCLAVGDEQVKEALYEQHDPLAYLEQQT